MSEDTFDEEWAREIAEEEADRLRKAEPAPILSNEEFLVWRSPRKANKNAIRLDNPLWHWLVRTRWSAYSGNRLFSGPSSFSAGPMWCFDRFGMSTTILPNGQIIYIGGEHEDGYDPDFYIYNDVIVIDTNGDIAIYGYPIEDFSPTDFHSATLIGDAIFIIGCLGDADQRMLGQTPVYRLALDSMQIRSIRTCGESPGWLYKHSASLANDGSSIIVSGGDQWLGNDHASSENIDSWSLNIVTGEWQRLTKLDWQRWTIRRTDGGRIRLWDVRQALWHRDNAHLGMESYWNYDDEPDFAALEMLYRLDKDTFLTEGPDVNVFSAVIDGLTVRFKEDHFWIEVIVEGQLTSERLLELQSKTLSMVDRLEGSECLIESPNSGSLRP